MMMICFVAIKIIKYFTIAIGNMSIVYGCYCSFDVIDAIQFLLIIFVVRLYFGFGTDDWNVTLGVLFKWYLSELVFGHIKDFTC